MIFYLYEKGGGGGISFGHAEGRGGGELWGSFPAVVLSFIHIGGGGKKFPLFKMGGMENFTLS